MPKKYAFEKKITIDDHRYTIRADSTEELAVKIAMKKRDIEENKVRITGSMTVKEWVKICLGTYKVNVSPDVLETMTLRINRHIVSQIGSYKLRNIKPIQCQAIINAQAGMSYSHVTKPVAWRKRCANSAYPTAFTEVCRSISARRSRMP